MKRRSRFYEIRGFEGEMEGNRLAIGDLQECEKSIGPRRAYSERCHAQLTTLENGNSRFHKISCRSGTARMHGKVRGRE